MEMEEFVGDTNHEYAILSHTWGEEEVSFRQYSAPTARLMAGYHKIEHSCVLASRSGLPYLWIDTCCIDKSSSAELSEAINSMYRWYRDAAVCYVYLSDMKRCELYQEVTEDGLDVNKNLQILQACRWFTRGWTLQELLAPRDVEFYDQGWESIGTKKSMSALLSRITGINAEHLWKSQEASVAQKMSWAAYRQTTRTEDIAYSLLGLFNVNMPLLYGEGKKAFRRLQHEILQSTNDESIFAWTDDRVWTSGLLAESPANFAESGHFVPINQFYRKPYKMTNQGFKIELLYSDPENEEAGRFETPLRCTGSMWDLWGQTIVTLHMTYYTDRTGALRALRTGTSQVGRMRNELVRDTETFCSFYIDDVRHLKLPPHWTTPLYKYPFTDGPCFDPLTLRLRGALHAEDVCISENTGMRGSEGSFWIVDGTNGNSIGRPAQAFPIMYAYWSHGRHLMINLGPFIPLGFDSNQKLSGANVLSSNSFELQAGNSLATGFNASKILFIAIVELGPLEIYIDIQLSTFHRRTEGLLKLTKANY